MSPFSKFLFAGLSLFSLNAIAASSADSVERKPLVIGTKIETGQIVQGSPVSTVDPDKYYISQIGVSLTQEVIVNRSLDVKVGAGGVFYNSFPAVIASNGSGYGVKFGPGITQAQALYKFGSPDNSWGALRVGYFSYKYNPDAKNLGEYMFRAGAYPTFAFTGGWSIMDNALVKVQGIEFSLSEFNGTLKHSFLIANERDFRPPGDFTPSYVVEYTKGPVQIGGGISFYHYFPIKEKETSPKNSDDAYYTFDDLPAFDAVNPRTGDTVHYAANQHIVAGTGDISGIISPALHSTWPSTVPDSVLGQYAHSTGHYTFKAIKLMARASFNIQKIAPIAMLNPQDLKVYGEMDLLGVKNYPGLYEKRLERMPVMMGINLPTFRILDAFSLEMEYWKNSNPDDMGMQQLSISPTYIANNPYTDNQSNFGYGLTPPPNSDPAKSYSILFRDKNANQRDNWKWSVYAVKQVITGISVRAQVANDHIRAQDTYVPGYWTAPALTRTPKDWYYVVSINFGI